MDAPVITEVTYYVPAGRNFRQAYADIPGLAATIAKILDGLLVGTTLEIKETLNSAEQQRFSVKKNANPSPATVLASTFLTATGLRAEQDRLISIASVPAYRVQLRIGVQRGILYDTQRISVPPLDVIEGSRQLLWLKVMPRLSTASPYDWILARLDTIRRQILAEFPSLPRPVAPQPIPPALALTPEQRANYDLALQLYEYEQSKLGASRLAAVERRALPELGTLSDKSLRLSLLQRLLFSESARLADETVLVRVGELDAAALPSLDLDRDALSARLERIGELESPGAGRLYSLLLRIDLQAGAGTPDRELELLFDGFTSTSAMDIGAAAGTSGCLLVFQRGRWPAEYRYMQQQPGNAPLEHQLSLRGVFSYAGTRSAPELRRPFAYGKRIERLPLPGLAGLQLYKRQGASSMTVVAGGDLLAQPEFSGDYIYAAPSPFKLGMLFPGDEVQPTLAPAFPLEDPMRNFTRFYVGPFRLQIDTEQLYSVSAPGSTVTISAARYFPDAQPRSHRFFWRGPRLSGELRTREPRLTLANLQDADTGVYSMRFLDTANNYTANFPVELELEALCRRCRRVYRGSKNHFGACVSHSEHPDEITARLQAQTVTLRGFLLSQFGPERCRSEPVHSLLLELRANQPERYLKYEARLEDIRCWINLNKRPESLTLGELEELSYRPGMLSLHEPARGLFDQSMATDQQRRDAADGEGPRNPNLFSGNAASSLNVAVRLCCRSRQELVPGCWTGRHSAATAVPSLHDWLQLGQRGSEQLNSRYATEQQHRRIVEASDEPARLLELEEQFNTVHGGVLEPQFHYTSQHGRELLESMLSASGNKYGRDLRRLFKHIDLSQPFSCWRRDELAAQRYDEREPDALPVYRGDRRKRTVQLILLFNALRQFPDRLKQTQELDMWLERREGIPRRGKYFRQAPPGVVAAVTAIELRIETSIRRAEPAVALLNQLSAEISSMQRELRDKINRGTVPPKDAYFVDTDLAKLNTRLASVLRLDSHLRALRLMRTQVGASVLDWIHHQPPATSDADWQVFADQVLADTNDQLDLTGIAGPSQVFTDNQVDAFGKTVKDIEQSLQTSDPRDEIRTLEAALAMALKNYQLALDAELQPVRPVLARLVLVASQLAALESGDRWELIGARVLSLGEVEVLVELNAYAASEAALRAEFVRATGADLPDPITALADVSAAEQSLTGKGLQMARRLETELVPLADRLTRSSEAVIWLMAHRLELDTVQDRATFMQAKSRYENGGAPASYTEQMQSLAAKLEHQPLHDGSSDNAYLAENTNDDIYEVYMALNSRTESDAIVIGLGLPYSSVLQAFADRRTADEKLLWKAGDELYKGYTDTRVQLYAYAALAAALSRLKPEDYKTDAETLGLYVNMLIEETEKASTHEEIGKLRDAFAYFDTKDSKLRPGFFENQEQRRAAREAAEQQAKAERQAEAARAAEEARLRAERLVEEARRQEDERLRELAAAEAAQARTDEERRAKQAELDRLKQEADERQEKLLRAEEEASRRADEEAAARQREANSQRSAELAAAKAEQERLEADDARERELQRKQTELRKLQREMESGALTSIVPIRRPELELLREQLQLLTVEQSGYGTPMRSPNTDLRVAEYQTRALERLDILINAADSGDPLSYTDALSVMGSDVELAMLRESDPEAYRAEIELRLANLNSEKPVLLHRLLGSIQQELDTAYGLGEALQYARPPSGDTPLPTSGDTFTSLLQLYLRQADFVPTYPERAYMLSGLALRQLSSTQDPMLRNLFTAVALAWLQADPMIDKTYADEEALGKEGLRNASQFLETLKGGARQYYESKPLELEFVSGLLRRLGGRVTFEMLSNPNPPLVLQLLLDTLGLFYSSQAEERVRHSGLNSASPEPQTVYRAVSASLANAKLQPSASLAVVLFVGIQFRRPLDRLEDDMDDTQSLYTLAAALSFDPKIATPHRVVLSGELSHESEGAKWMQRYDPDESSPLDGYLLAAPRTRYLWREGGRPVRLYDAAGEAPRGKLDYILEVSPSLELARSLGEASRARQLDEDAARGASSRILEIRKAGLETETANKRSPEYVGVLVAERLAKRFVTQWNNLIETMAVIRPDTKLLATFANTLSRYSIDSLVSKQLDSYAPGVQLSERLGWGWMMERGRNLLASVSFDPAALSQLDRGLYAVIASLSNLPKPSSTAMLDAGAFERQLFAECAEFLAAMTAKFDTLTSFYLYISQLDQESRDSTSELGELPIAVEKAYQRALAESRGLFRDEYRLQLKSIRATGFDFRALDNLALSLIEPVQPLIGAPIEQPAIWETMESALDQFYRRQGPEEVYDRVLTAMLQQHYRESSGADKKELENYNKRFEETVVPLARDTLVRLADYVWDSGRTGSADRVYCYVALLLTLYREIVNTPASPLIRFYLRPAQGLTGPSGLSKMVKALGEAAVYIEDNASLIEELNNQLERQLFVTGQAYIEGANSYRKPGAPEIIQFDPTTSKWAISTEHRFMANLPGLRFVRSEVVELDLLARDAEQYATQRQLVSVVNRASMPEWVKANRTGGESRMAGAARATLSFFGFGKLVRPPVPSYVVASPAALSRVSALVSELESACESNKVFIVSTRHSVDRQPGAGQVEQLLTLLREPGISRSKEKVRSELNFALPDASIRHPSITVDDSESSRALAVRVLTGQDNLSTDEIDSALLRFYRLWDVELDMPGTKAEIQRRYDELSAEEKARFNQPFQLVSEGNVDDRDLDDPVRDAKNARARAAASFANASIDLDLKIDNAVLELFKKGADKRRPSGKTLKELLSSQRLNEPGVCLPAERRLRNEFGYFAVDAEDRKTVRAWALWNTDADCMQRVSPDFEMSLAERRPENEALLQLIGYGSEPALGRLLLAAGMLDAHYCDQKRSCYAVLPKTPGAERRPGLGRNPVQYAAAGLRETLFSLVSNFRPAFDITEPADRLGRTGVGLSDNVTFRFPDNVALQLDSIAGLAVVPSVDDPAKLEVRSRNQLLPLEIELDSGSAPADGDLAVPLSGGKTALFRRPIIGGFANLPLIGAGKKKGGSSSSSAGKESNEARYNRLRDEILAVPTTDVPKFEATLGLGNDPDNPLSVSLFYAAIWKSLWSSVFKQGMLQGMVDRETPGDSYTRQFKLLVKDLDKIHGSPVVYDPTASAKSVIEGWRTGFLHDSMQLWLDRYADWLKGQSKDTVPLPEPSPPKTKKQPPAKAPTPPLPSPSPPLVVPSPEPAPDSPPPQSVSGETPQQRYERLRSAINAIPSDELWELEGVLKLRPVSDDKTLESTFRLIVRERDWDRLLTQRMLVDYKGSNPDMTGSLGDIKSDVEKILGTPVALEGSSPTAQGLYMKTKGIFSDAMEVYLAAYSRMQRGAQPASTPAKVPPQEPPVVEDSDADSSSDEIVEPDYESPSEEEEEEEPARPSFVPEPADTAGFAPSTDYSLGYAYLRNNPIARHSAQLGQTNPILISPYLAYCADITESTVHLNIRLAQSEVNKAPRNPMIRTRPPIGSPQPVRSGIARFFAPPPQ